MHSPDPSHNSNQGANHNHDPECRAAKHLPAPAAQASDASEVAILQEALDKAKRDRDVLEAEGQALATRVGELGTDLQMATADAAKHLQIDRTCHTLRSELEAVRVDHSQQPLAALPSCGTLSQSGDALHVTIAPPPVRSTPN